MIQLYKLYYTCILMSFNPYNIKITAHLITCIFIKFHREHSAKGILYSGKFSNNIVDR